LLNFDIIDNILPIGNPDWEKVWQEHLAAYPTMERTPELLKRKFQELVRKNFLLVDWMLTEERERAGTADQKF
jgi:hypothetical protein